ISETSMSKQTVIITGAGGGLAVHVARAFEQAGWQMGLVAYDDAERERVMAAHPHSTVSVGDLSHADSAQACLHEITQAIGTPHALLNIAGGFAMASATDTTPAALEAQLSINLRTAFNATRALLPDMLDRGNGFILGVGAAAALDGGAAMGAYAASKAALIAWLKSLRAEIAPKGIDVSILYPMAAIDTPGNRHAMPDADPSQWINPQELAATIMHLATRSGRGRLLEARVYPPA
ncbi:MAG: SDR family NAD(P)-dependent oxidoreductase, partial [Xanthomonadales bacterium]|nr:SDR family NAD(P)-dependent oxidoreductase [Xanthomonadales bacterium]